MGGENFAIHLLRFSTKDKIFSPCLQMDEAIRLTFEGSDEIFCAHDESFEAIAQICTTPPEIS
jgi:hypothetical protein